MNQAAVLAALTACALLVSCRTAPVYTVQNAPVNASLAETDVRDAILAAGPPLGWQMRQVGDGLIEATLHIRDHVATVEIPYDDTSYSIRYKDSQNLKYDGAQIHSNYNGWVRNLQNAINVRLAP